MVSALMQDDRDYIKLCHHAPWARSATESVREKEQNQISTMAFWCSPIPPAPLNLPLESSNVPSFQPFFFNGTETKTPYIQGSEKSFYETEQQAPFYNLFKHKETKQILVSSSSFSSSFIPYRKTLTLKSLVCSVIIILFLCLPSQTDEIRCNSRLIQSLITLGS